LSTRHVTPQTDVDIVELASSRPTILAVGQILPFKGTHLFVDAILQLRREGLDVQGIVLGSLPIWPPESVEYAAQLRRRAEEEGQTDRLHFVGVRENILEIMRASFLLATPILGDEAFGNVALEARSVGLPVVTFARGGLTELVDHGVTGYVCDTSDLQGLVTGLRHYLQNPCERARASANSLRVSTAPENDCTASEFERRWWTIFGADRAVQT
jgi:glycosyltransferase involved in cell wall biosynthesis